MTSLACGKMAYEEEMIADTDAKDDHRALRARSAQCIVGPRDLVESESGYAPLHSEVFAGKAGFPGLRRPQQQNTH